MQKSSLRACFSSIIHSAALQLCEICRICKFLEICGFNAFCVRCILLVFSQKTHIYIKICILIKMRIFCRNSYFPDFCEFCPSIFHKKNIATPKKTTYFARSAQKWRAQKMGVNELRYLAEICVKIMFLSMFSSIICTLNLELVIYIYISRCEVSSGIWRPPFA